MEKPIFIEMMFTRKWSYNAGETDASKKTLHKLSLLDICKQSGALNNLLIHFIFDCTCSLIS